MCKLCFSNSVEVEKTNKKKLFSSYTVSTKILRSELANCKCKCAPASFRVVELSPFNDKNLDVFVDLDGAEYYSSDLVKLNKKTPKCKDCGHYIEGEPYESGAEKQKKEVYTKFHLETRGKEETD